MIYSITKFRMACHSMKEGRICIWKLNWLSDQIPISLLCFDEWFTWSFKSVERVSISCNNCDTCNTFERSKHVWCKVLAKSIGGWVTPGETRYFIFQQWVQRVVQISTCSIKYFQNSISRKIILKEIIPDMCYRCQM